MRVLILGGGGMLGHKLWQSFRGRFDTWVTVRAGFREYAKYGIFDRERMLPGVDASNLDTIVRALGTVKPDVVINCIGVIKQLESAKDPVVSLSINSLLPHRLAELCRVGGARFLHISTDCVFNGARGMRTEDDDSDAIDLYGRSKSLGEVSAPGSLTLRTSIIGRELSGASGLIDWFLTQRGGTVRGFRHAIYTGFTTPVLAEIIADLLERQVEMSGVWQVSSEPISKFDLLGLVNDVYGLGIRIEPETDFVCDRSLDSTRFRAATGFRPPTWPEMIEGMYRDPTPYDRWREK
jgi:dTDP-4-dehydrorhamnose reductase